MKKLLIVAAMAALAYGGVRVLRGHHTDEAATEATVTDGDQLALDRLWVDHMPRNDKDTIQVFAAITEEPLGIFQATSVWKGAFEMFVYEAHGEEIRMVFPQTNDHAKVKAKARTCNDKRDMDYCLELDGSSRGVKRYYSRKGWEIDGHMQDRIETLLRSLPAQD